MDRGALSIAVALEGVDRLKVLSPRCDGDKNVKLAATGTSYPVEAGFRLNLIQHLRRNVKGLRSGEIVGAGNRIRQYRLNLIQKFTIFHTFRKIRSCRAAFTGTFYEMTNVEIEIVIIFRFV